MEGDNTIDFYKECQRNHAASLGSYATDGCGEFMIDFTNPAGLQCDACGCHRNFHRKVTYGARASYSSRGAGNQDAATEVTGHAGEGSGGQMPESPESERTGGKKRFRTKFTSDQKEKMLSFAGKLGWKLPRKDHEDEVSRFCRGVGVSRKVFKVWMHNHKNSTSTSTGNVSPPNQ